MFATPRRFGLAALLSLLCAPAFAQVPMTGAFTAEASCEATPAIRSDDNPGRIVTEPGRAYELLGRNSDPGSHYLIRVPSAEPERRWVAFGCGRAGESSQSAQAGSSPSAAKPEVRNFVLAASWQPAFCEIRSQVRECRDGAAGVQGFSLHGLWPQPRDLEYCGVDGRERSLAEGRRWLDLPETDLSTSTRAALAQAMPGVASGLDRYQWAKHGTCWGGSEEAFFAASVRLLADLNASPVRELFEHRIGGSVRVEEIREAFDAAFGRGAGSRVLLDCAGGRDGERMIQELRISVSGDLRAGVPLGEMMRDARAQPAGCRGGHVDPPGFG